MEKPRSFEERRGFWEKRLRDWSSSGLSQAEYCRQNKLSIKSFGYWKRKLKVQSSPVCLVEVPVPPPRPVLSSSASIRLIVNNQYRLDIEKEFDRDLLD
jgi:hypothetical protein